MIRSISKLLVVFCALLVTPITHAASASGISQMWIVGDTSAIYNPVLPSPLTTTTIVEQMNWDSVPYGQLASNRLNGGAWTAFVVATIGYYDPTTLHANYKGSPATYFGPSYNLRDSTGIVYGTFDIFYCGCSAGGYAEAYANSAGTPFYSHLYIQ